MTFLVRCTFWLATIFLASESARAQKPFRCTASAVPALVRAEGVTELMGDMVIDCQGGVPTLAGAPVPKFNLQVFLNTQITSRLLDAQNSEALLLLDEPQENNQRVCTQLSCTIVGTGAGVRYSAPGTATPNVFQGTQVLPNSVAFLGVPLDAAGNGTRTLRVTNIRGNASQLGVPPGNLTQAIVMSISITAGSPVVIANSQVVVAYCHVGLVVSRFTTTANGSLRPVGDVPVTLGPCTPSQGFVVRVQEGFASSFKTVGPISVGSFYDPFQPPPPPVARQAAVGLPVFTETGFYNPDFPTIRGVQRAGLADHGTRLLLKFSNVPAGVFVSVSGPSSAWLVDSAFEGNSATYIFEVVSADPFLVESLDFSIGISTSSSHESGAVQLSWGFAPQSTVPFASATEPIPRFGPSIGNLPAFTVYPCYSSLLFPFVTNQAGNETALVISNTSVDPFGTTPTSGTCTVHYYGTTANGGPPPSQTSGIIAAGTTLAFTLGGGGSSGIQATPGFQGYIIATCRFPYVHGFAGVGSVNAQRIGYQAIVLDQPGLVRTNAAAESSTH